MRRRSTPYNSTYTIIDGIDDVLYDSIVVAYQNDNREILGEIFNAIDDIVYSSIETVTPLIFERNLPLIKWLYAISLSDGKYSALLRRKSYDGIKEKISSILFRVEHNIDKSSNEVLITQFLHTSLTHYNILLHDILIKKDYETYKNAIQVFYSFIFKKYLRHESDKPKDNLAYQAEYYVNSVAIIQYSWILYLYKKNKLTTKECLDFLNENKLSARNYERILDTLIYIEGVQYHNLFGVGNWEEDVEKINYSMARSPLQPKYWTALGMMVYLLKNSGLVTREINPNRIKSSDRFFRGYFEEFQNCLSEIKENKEVWIPIIFNNTLSDITTNSNHEDEFFSKIEYVSTCLKKAALQLIKIEQVNKHEKLVSQPFSEAKADRYKDAVGSEWYQRSFLHRLFDKYGNWEEIEDSPSIPINRFFVFQHSMKMMFVDDDYNFVYGSTDFGRLIANEEDAEFLNSVKIADTPVRNFSNILDCLDTLIENLLTNKFNPSVIILGSDWLYRTNDLAFNENFIPDWKLKEDLKDENIDFSLYKNIPLYTSTNDNFEEYIIVADFENAFTLKQVRDDSWYKNQLQVKTIPIDDVEAKRIFDEDPEEWKGKSADSIQFSEAEALNFIKTGVVWDVNVREIFEIKNPLAYTIGQIHIEKTLNE